MGGAQRGAGIAPMAAGAAPRAHATRAYTNTRAPIPRARALFE